MNYEISGVSLDTLFAKPAVNLLRIAAAAAAPGGELDIETLQSMRAQVARDVLDDLEPAECWPELARGLMSQTPSRMLRVLRRCDALAVLLPELDALFGQPQSASNDELVDIGEHQLRVVDETVRANAGLIVRFAALLFNAGKADSPPEHLPSHYRHVERGLTRVHAVCNRFGVPGDFRDFALLATAELERVHRAAEMRAGSIAAMLERVDAYGRPERFRNLLSLCACDYRAFPGQAGLPYPKAFLLDKALQAALAVDPALLAEAEDSTPEDALLAARTTAIALALGSERWAGDD
jgi:tRNA nucleotidyltransferase (CCA-adding enzyme)